MLEMAENLAILRIGFKNIQLFKGEVLGIGSYGIVCKAKGDDLLCAAKCLHPGSFDPSEQENIAHNEALVKRIRRFEREIELLKEIRHPNIVLYLCLHEDTETGLPVILMELMDKNLTQFLESGSPETNLYHIHVDICHDIALALSFLHLNDIIHRDLSSNNVLLISHYRAKISDFGMAGLNLKKQTALSRNPGTDVYMPPEALKRNPDYNEKMDCFSFGVLVIQILTQKFPEPDSSFEEVDNVCRCISEEQRRQNHISQIDPTHLLLPLSIKCLSNQDTDRPSAQQICEAISELKESTQYTESKKVIEKQSLPELNNGDAQIHDLQLLERPVHEGWPGVDAGIGQLGAGLEDNKIQLKWTISDEKIRLKWNNAVIDDDVIYYRVGKEIHAHRVYGISNRWIPLAGNCPHTDCPIVIINNQLTTIGGLPLTNKLFGLEIDHHPMSWNERYPPMLTRRQRASALCTNNELIVAGGMGENMSVLTVVEVMKLDTPQWSTAANLREPTYMVHQSPCVLIEYSSLEVTIMIGNHPSQCTCVH